MRDPSTKSSPAELETDTGPVSMGAVRIVSLLAACGAAFTVAVTVFAQPQVPATYFGSVTVGGKPAEAGTDVRGLVDGIDCTQAAPGARPVLRDGETAVYVVYVVHNSQRPGCARDGSMVTFTIGGVPALQSALWKPGPLRLDLSVGSEPPIPLPSPTGTIASAIATASGGTVPAATQSVAVTTVSGSTRAGAAGLATTTASLVAEEPDPGGGHGVSVVLVVIGVGGLAAVASAFGVYLAGRKRHGESET